MKDESEQINRNIGITNQQQIQEYVHMSWILKPQLDRAKNIFKGGLAISSVFYFQNQQQIFQENISAVLTACGQKFVIPFQFPPQVQRFCISIGDHPRQDIGSFFNSTYEFIDRNLKRGNVIVHCRAGISRSATIVIAYLIKKNKLKYQEAFQLVKAEREVIQPNKGFEKQLKKYAKIHQKPKYFFLIGPLKWCISS